MPELHLQELLLRLPAAQGPVEVAVDHGDGSLQGGDDLREVVGGEQIGGVFGNDPHPLSLQSVPEFLLNGEKQLLFQQGVRPDRDGQLSLLFFHIQIKHLRGGQLRRKLTGYVSAEQLGKPVIQSGDDLLMMGVREGRETLSRALRCVVSRRT